MYQYKCLFVFIRFIYENIINLSTIVRIITKLIKKHECLNKAISFY
nr:MAG TPA: hypothetical protein [Caudoviricetes sp.]